MDPSPPDTPTAGPPAPAGAPEPRARASALAAMAGQLADPGFPTGEHAALRRMDPRPGRIGGAALPFERLRAGAGVGEGDAERWALVVHALALARGRHDPRRPTGAALREAGLTDERLDLLLAADLDTLFDLLPRLARRLAASGAALDWLPLVEVVMNAGRDEAAADRARLRIARGYARAADKPKGDG